MDWEEGRGGGGGVECTTSLSLVQKLDVQRGIGSLQLVIYLHGTTSPRCRAKDTLGQDEQGAHIN